MVKRSPVLDAVFSSLADPTRRDILMRVSKQQLTVGEIAKPYKLTFAAISKHLSVLEKANLVSKKRQGKFFVVQLAPGALAEASDYLEKYRQMWENRLDRLEKYLQSVQ